MNTNDDKLTKNQLGYVLRLLRIANNNMSIKELSQKTNIASNYVSEIESGKKNPSLEILAKYSKALNIRESTILYFAELNKKENSTYQTLLIKILEEIAKKEGEVV